MLRLNRLPIPAAVFAVVGLAQTAFAASSAFNFRGGLTAAAVYAFALQVVWSVFLFSVVDDSEDSRIVSGLNLRSASFGRNARLDGALRALRITVRYYSAKLIPAVFLGLGLSLTFTTFLVGELDQPVIFGQPGIAFFDNVVLKSSELVVALCLAVAMVLFAVFYRGPGQYGWLFGFSIGCAIVQVALDSGSYVPVTLAGWAIYGLLLCGVLALLVWMLPALRRLVHIRADADAPPAADAEI